MAYSRQLHERVRAEIKDRKNIAEMNAAANRDKLTSQYPEFLFIEEELAKTGMSIVRAFSLPKEDVETALANIRKKNEELHKERKNLLKALKLPSDYLDVKYTCKKCEDTGVYEERDDERNVSYGSKYCECYMSLLKKYAAQELNKNTPLELSNFEDFSLDYYPATKSGDSPKEAMSYVYNSCVKYAESFDLDSVSLYFYGRTGLGKTHLSLAIANEAIKKGYNVIYGSVINFLNKMEKEKFGKADTDTEKLLIDADLLILDDLGAEFTTAYTVSAIYNILNSRICRGVPTIISSNLDLDDIKGRYPESIASRIIGTFSPVEFIGDDVRQIMNEE
ncbi:MAG: ATP-binding protein [Clostridia bacterium]|nr:ATP-binding protein [Clostridia bacterium]